MKSQRGKVLLPNNSTEVIVPKKRNYNEGDSTSQSDKKKKKVRKGARGNFQFFACKNARINDKNCNKTMCSVCMNTWVETGEQFPVILTEEKVRETKSIKLDTGEVRARGKPKIKKIGEDTVPRKRRSSRKEERNMSDQKAVVFKKDMNGCTHELTDVWQPITDPIYLNPDYQEKLKTNERKRNTVLSRTCYVCKEIILDDGTREEVV